VAIAKERLAEQIGVETGYLEAFAELSLPRLGRRCINQHRHHHQCQCKGACQLEKDKAGTSAGAGPFRALALDAVATHERCKSTTKRN
jgi:hypothetical protein